MSTLELVIDGVDFGEGPRWHDGKLWYSDFYQRAVYTVDTAGIRLAVHEGLDDQPSGLGWMPDGSLLVVAMTSRKVLREVDGELVEHGDLSGIATWHCNDMIVDGRGNAYVGNFGFDLSNQASFAPASLALVRPDGSVSVAAPDLAFPNGMVIPPGGDTLIVGQTFAGDYLAFDIGTDGGLTNRRQWAQIEGTAPDGCTLDADGGIWFADAVGSQLVRVVEGGEVTGRISTPMPVYACALGGHHGRTLYAFCAPDADPASVEGKAAGAIYAVTVTSPHAGLP